VHRTHDQYWQERTLKSHVNDFPVLASNGWFDVESRGAFMGYRSTKTSGSKLLVMGAHDGSPAGTPGPFPAYARWFDHHVRGIVPLNSSRHHVTSLARKENDARVGDVPRRGCGRRGWRSGGVARLGDGEHALFHQLGAVFHGAAGVEEDEATGKAREDGVLVGRVAQDLAAAEAALAGFDLEVELSDVSDRDPPSVRELGGRIPHEADRHVDPDGKLCVVLPDAYWYLYPGGLSLGEFLREPLRAYLACQALIEAGDKTAWPRGEWSHGEAGVLEFYQGVLRVAQPAAVARLIGLALRPHTGGVGKCPCGSNRSFTSCHSTRLFAMRSRIPRIRLRAALARIASLATAHAGSLDNGEGRA